MSRYRSIHGGDLAGLSLLLATAGPTLADDAPAVGVGASAYVDDYALDVFIEQEVESALLAGGSRTSMCSSTSATATWSCPVHVAPDPLAVQG